MKTLILNMDFQPFDIWGWKKTMKKLLDSDHQAILPVYGKDGQMVKHDMLIRDGRGNTYDLPAVAVLKKYINVHNKVAPYTKMNIYARDLYHCQYCNCKTDSDNRTIDHVIPRAHWNPRRYTFRLSSFENVVTCCRACNMQKRNRTPQQANMQLIRKPRKITRSQAYQNKLSLGIVYDKWLPFLGKNINDQT